MILEALRLIGSVIWNLLVKIYNVATNYGYYGYLLL